MLVLPSFKTFGGEILHRCLIFGKITGVIEPMTGVTSALVIKLVKVD